MVLSLLDLPDEALRLIFLALGTEILVDSSRRSRYNRNEARSLSNCSKRLYTIYRTSVRTLRSRKSCSVTSCARLWDRFPHIAALDLNFEAVPGFRRIDFRASTSPVPWRGESGAFPNGLVRNGIKSIQLQMDTMHVRELQEMLQNCIGLEELNLEYFNVHLDREQAEYTDEMCTFSLERHAGSMKKLVVHYAQTSSRPYYERFVDLRWLLLRVMSSLMHLELNRIVPCGHFISDLPTLPSLEYLSLIEMAIEDEDLEAILPSLPRLHSVNVFGCEKLTYRVLQCLPSHLEFLGVTLTDVLTLPPGAEEIDFLSHSSWGREGTGLVKSLEAMSLKDGKRFDLLLHLFDGVSISHLRLNNCELASSSLVGLLSEAPRLLKLELRCFRGLDEGAFSAVSQMASLRELDLFRTRTKDEWLALLATGPCRMSLRFIDLKECTEFEDRAGARRLVAERFHSCDLQF